MSKSKGPNCNKVAEQVRAMLKPLIWSDGFFYQYLDGCWRKLDEVLIKKIAKTRLGLKSTQHRIQETLKNLQLDCDIASTILNRRSELLNVRNGMLDLTSLKLQPHDQAAYSTNQLPVVFDADAQSPRWNQFLNEVLGDKPEKIDFLLEWMGYCLIPDTRQEKFAILLGDGANGKGTVISIMEALVGEENYSALSLHSLSNPHYLIELHGKLANLATESGVDLLKRTEIIKQIVSGDTLTADRKYAPPVKFKPSARLTFAVNQLPAIKDTSYGFFRRPVILEFNRTFDEKSRDRQLRDKLRGELNGIFLSIIGSLKRLRDRGHLIEPPSSQARIAKYRQETSSVLTFVKEVCELSPDVKVQAGPFHVHYVNWARTHGIRYPEGSVKFSEQLLTLFNGQIVRKEESDANYYCGIRVKPD